MLLSISKAIEESDSIFHQKDPEGIKAYAAHIHRCVEEGMPYNVFNDWN